MHLSGGLVFIPTVTVLVMPPAHEHQYKHRRGGDVRASGADPPPPPSTQSLVRLVV
ncbi:hypothetical protein BDZ89DRAFT_1068627 [Hymenopellis radicata]|nr:hypothetical protein BDZ89DRAFT_1068627 [Hymenopellis radicata]